MASPNELCLAVTASVEFAQEKTVSYENLKTQPFWR